MILRRIVEMILRDLCDTIKCHRDVLSRRYFTCGKLEQKCGGTSSLFVRKAQLFSARRSNYKRNELYRESSRAAIIRVQESPNYYAAIRVNGQDQRHRARALVNRRALPFRDCSNRDYNWQLGMPGRKRIAWVTLACCVISLDLMAID